MKLTLVFNGAQLTADHLQQVISAAGANTSIQVYTAQAMSLNTLQTCIGLAGSKKNLGLDFNGAQLNANNLQQAVSAAGSNVSFSVNTAQAVNISTLVDIFKTNKKVSAEFNGAQLVASNLQLAVNAAGTNSYVSVNTAHAADLNALLGAIKSGKNFGANFNGAQLNSNLQKAIAAADYSH
ncbi:hypothetical protein R0G64_04755 [Pseudomonas otitidis]|uniref:Uncharacterized protein n=1 Tax=Metapseudomonas otitidis TaxID=319939 RepID=A0ABU3XLB2_9GAMM|nr:hypothetical protein [Pseudomonas otitidis]MDV3438742.1 hypothetical protein [Pseudomonas otitidis]